MPNPPEINFCHWPDRLWTNKGLAAFSISSLIQKPLSSPPTHFDPNPIIQMQHAPPMLQPVSSAVPYTDIAIHILSSLVIHHEAQGGEVGHLDAGLVIGPLNLVVQPPHVLHVVRVHCPETNIAGEGKTLCLLRTYLGSQGGTRQLGTGQF